jgi:hypothetical protein
MTFFNWLEIGAQIAAIATALIAGWAYGRYLYERRQKRRRLENYLKKEKDAGKNRGQRTVLHLVAELGMTDAEIIDAAFRSRCIVRKVTPDMMGAASKLLLEYSASNSN